MIDCCVRVPHFTLGKFLSDMWDFHGGGGRWMGWCRVSMAVWDTPDSAHCGISTVTVAIGWWWCRVSMAVWDTPDSAHCGRR